MPYFRAIHFDPQSPTRTLHGHRPERALSVKSSVDAQRLPRGWALKPEWSRTSPCMSHSIASQRSWQLRLATSDWIVPVQ